MKLEEGILLGFSGPGGRCGCCSSLNIIWIHWRVERKEWKYLVSVFKKLALAAMWNYDYSVIKIGSGTTLRRLQQYSRWQMLMAGPGWSWWSSRATVRVKACVDSRAMRLADGLESIRPNKLLVKNNIWENHVSNKVWLLKMDEFLNAFLFILL